MRPDSFEIRRSPAVEDFFLGSQFQPTDQAVNHKWEDFTIFEPDPMRMWRNWCSELGSNYPELSGNIGSATKITIAPKAFSLLLAEADPHCSWPSVDSDDILFTFAGLDRDKVKQTEP
jgi:hypothetical protein